MIGRSENQKRILDYLLDHQDGATLEELASHLSITKSAAREHVVKLENLGYLTFKDTKGLIGRPRRTYLLSKTGQDAFPKQYSWLSKVLLETLADDLGEDAVIRLMDSLADKVSDSMAPQFQNAKSTSELLALITAAMNELGYRSTLRQSDVRKGAVLEATNCVYHEVALKHPELCRFDVRLLENASGMDVKLESCIAKGGNVCRFCLKKKKA